ncbi:MAG: hypothetical protein Q8M77_12350 [Hydrogenophaga sp.]|nr:hypothetical protein [Hydrogenophaga sp.]
MQGTSEANAFIELSFSGGFTRTTQANGSGSWSYSLTGADFTAMGLGAETVAATATDLAGNTNGAQDSRAFNVQSLDVTPADITGPSGAAGAPSSVGSAAENTTAVHTFTANETVTWSLNGGADAAQFSLNATTGALIFLAAPNFEAPADGGGDNTYTVVVRAVDAAGNAADQTVAITVTNANDNTPAITSVAAANFAEGGTGTVYTAAASDADGSLNPISYAIGGTDAALFSINASTGAVTYDELLAIWDAHNGAGTGTGSNGLPAGWSDYNYYWTATPGPTTFVSFSMLGGLVADGFVGSDMVALEVVSQITSASTANVFEDAPTSKVVYDADGFTVLGDSTLTWSLQGADAARFTIDADDGEVRFVASPDFEAPLDAGGNNVYDITVRGTTSNGGWVDKDVAITVRDIVTTLNLGTWGKLIAPVQVDGGQLYYFWDRSGDGTSAGVDYATHNFLDAIFQYDINGVLETAGNAVGAVGETDNTYRYANLNGVQVALPTYGSTLSGINADNLGYLNGTAIDNSPVGEVNPTYDDLLAIWDAHNGAGTGTGSSGIPAGWADYYYLSATPTAGGHAGLYPGNNSYVFDADENFNSYMALQVL